MDKHTVLCIVSYIAQACYRSGASTLFGCLFIKLNDTLARTGYAGGAPLPTGAPPQVFRLHVMIM